jgi:hypoxanthine phosphoribosyltransferase
MAKKLKGVVFGITNVIAKTGSLDVKLMDEIGKLIRFLLTKNITPIFYGNHDYVIKNENGQQTRLQTVITQRWGSFPWYIAETGNAPWKPNGAASRFVLDNHGWDPAEVVYVGNTDEDMRTAIHGRLLFLNVTWYGQNNQYGFFFDTPWDIARFIETFCLREHLWHYKIEEPSLRFYALAPYSTQMPEFSVLSTDARNAAKSWGLGHPDFWTKYLWSTIYFSELYKEIDYIVSIPGHSQGFGNSIMEQPMLAFGKCFYQTYLRDLIYRHVTIEKSSSLRAQQRQAEVDHRRQLNSIYLTRLPLRASSDERYKNCPIRRGKTVLVTDDICTNGYSLEAAAAYIRQTGANVIGMSWLKTINRDYMQINDDLGAFNPFQPNVFNSIRSATSYRYKDHITDRYAPDEVTQKLQAYDCWHWPAGL